MPFDALVMRAIEARWRERLIGAVCVRLFAANDRLLLTVKRAHDQQSEQLLVVLKPGVQRLHRTERAAEKKEKRAPFPWLSHLVPFTIQHISVPPFERVMSIGIERADDWGQPQEETLVVELAGHLTNLILIDANGLVVEAWRKIPPGRPGRSVWPKKPYEPPPRLPNPLETRNPQDLPPWGRRWVAEGGDFDRLLENFQEGFPGPGYLLFSPQAEDIWVYPQAGFQTKATEDVELALDEVFGKRERQQRQEALKAQVISQVKERRAHLIDKRNQYQVDQQETGEKDRGLGDLWLTYQQAFKADPTLCELTVTDMEGNPVLLRREPGENPTDIAAAHYRRYKKVKARQEALSQLIPAIEAELRHLDRLLQEAENPHPLSWYQDQLKTRVSRSSAGNEQGPFRHFVSQHGFEILVGRNREENAKLTFQKARPDDIWLHTKQAPGSHVILATGKKTPDLEDLLDAAELAVFFSSAQGSSTVPVDYTRRKFVRKRPHAEPGQVLYQREKTLYITPSPERLRRLGAISEKIVDNG